MISPAQRLLGGLAPPLRSVHVMFQGQAPFAALSLARRRRPSIVRKRRRPEDDEDVLFVLR